MQKTTESDALRKDWVNVYSTYSGTIFSNRFCNVCSQNSIASVGKKPGTPFHQQSKTPFKRVCSIKTTR